MICTPVEMIGRYQICESRYKGQDAISAIEVWEVGAEGRRKFRKCYGLFGGKITTEKATLDAKQFIEICQERKAQEIQ